MRLHEEPRFAEEAVAIAKSYGIATAAMAVLSCASMLWLHKRNVQTWRHAVIHLAPCLPTLYFGWKVGQYLQLARELPPTPPPWTEPTRPTLPRLLPAPATEVRSLQELCLDRLFTEGEVESIPSTMDGDLVLAAAIRHSPQAYRWAIENFQVTQLDLTPLAGHIGEADVRYLADHQPTLHAFTLVDSYVSEEGLQYLLERTRLEALALHKCPEVEEEFVTTIGRCQGETLRVLKLDKAVLRSWLAAFECLEQLDLEMPLFDDSDESPMTLACEKTLKRLSHDGEPDGTWGWPALERLEFSGRFRPPGDLAAFMQDLCDKFPDLKELKMGFSHSAEDLRVLAGYADRFTHLDLEVRGVTEDQLKAFFEPLTHLKSLGLAGVRADQSGAFDDAGWELVQRIIPPNLKELTLGVRAYIGSATLNAMVEAPYRVRLDWVMVRSAMTIEQLVATSKTFCGEPREKCRLNRRLWQEVSSFNDGGYREQLQQEQGQLKFRQFGFGLASGADIEEKSRFLDHMPVLAELDLYFEPAMTKVGQHLAPLAARCRSIPRLIMTNCTAEQLRPFLTMGEGRHLLVVKSTELTCEKLIALLEEGHRPECLSVPHLDEGDRQAIQQRFPEMRLLSVMTAIF